ncbi:4-(cytidine 5'-diphospho)-2-C-methyl-D-erythritol kinase [Sulfurimonas sp.]|nr:4-(cytidine 5'-diphospho)-2-C-methyl-D-erythritol kinase [Sulfurimonas sp.]
MGGFAGGDEGGYWDVDTLANSINRQNKNKSKSINKVKSYIQTSDSVYSIEAHAKVNIFFKITGFKDERFTFTSRYMQIEDLYDTISFVPCKCNVFTIEGCDEVPLESNSIYKAYHMLNDYINDSDIVDFFCEHKVVVKKRIPYSSGLGGSSSDAAAFLRLVKEVCNLVISTEELSRISCDLGTDLAFFIYNYPSANVSGFGEVVEAFEEEPLHFTLHTPQVKCDKNVLYERNKKQLLEDISIASFNSWDQLDSKSILSSTSPSVLNDLYKISLITYPDIKEEAKEDYFFSGNIFFEY